MADLAQPSTDAGARRFLARWDRQFQSLQSPAVRYGLAIVSVAGSARADAGGQSPTRPFP